MYIFKERHPRKEDLNLGTNNLITLKPETGKLPGEIPVKFGDSFFFFLT